MAQLVTRRSMLRCLGAAAGTGLAGFAAFEYGTRIEPRRLQLTRSTVPIDGLGTSLDGFRIALLSDFHLYPHTTLDLIGEAVQLTNQLKPDLIVLGGDYVLRSADAIFDLAPALAKLNAPRGIFAIMGNHDHWKGVETVAQGLTEAGIPILRNRGVGLDIGPEQLFLAGVDDGWVGRHDLKQALSGHKGQPTTIVLMHEPDFADAFSSDSRIHLQLSGHSHGGQVRIPFYGSPFLPPYGRKYDKGRYRVGDMWVYTTVGIGVTAPIRLNCPPEICELTLVRSQG